MPPGGSFLSIFVRLQADFDRNRALLQKCRSLKPNNQLVIIIS